MGSHHYTVHIDQRGRLVLPSEVRKQLGLKKGDALILAVEPDGVLRLLSLREVARRGRGILRKLVPTAAHRRLSEELIKERRIEAEYE